jgi:Raf kinase inhibitor-like YbhB/YbcL family protein
MPGRERRSNAARLPVRAADAGWAGIVALALVVSGCNDDGRDLQSPSFPPPTSTTVPPTTIDPAAPLEPTTTPPPITAAVLQLVAPWPDGAEVSVRHTCDDVDVSPALSWSNVPAESVELAITVTDLTAGFTHWLITGLEPGRTALAEGEIPVEGLVRVNDFGQPAWAGPCPPEGEAAHTYLVTLHALNQQLEVADDAATDEVISLLNQTAIAQTSVAGTFARAG